MVADIATNIMANRNKPSEGSIVPGSNLNLRKQLLVYTNVENMAVTCRPVLSRSYTSVVDSGHPHKQLLAVVWYERHVLPDTPHPQQARYLHLQWTMDILYP